MKQDGRVYLRVPEAEKALWEEQAALCGYKSLSDWIRVRCDVSRGEEELEGVEVPVAVSAPPAVVTAATVQKSSVSRYLNENGHRIGCKCMRCSL